eukprot:gb/GEZN01020232.1/.p1 GENE.gb/GEZN01020232.1/~~gb/GEZN01020232.1/.p1  ORF type:complete len:124 (-),score=4.47 gb/GEZN01020232.1/:40-411(-)
MMGHHAATQVAARCAAQVHHPCPLSLTFTPTSTSAPSAASTSALFSPQIMQLECSSEPSNMDHHVCPSLHMSLFLLPLLPKGLFKPCSLYTIEARRSREQERRLRSAGITYRLVPIPSGHARN